jgi:hypothetical protein
VLLNALQDFDVLPRMINKAQATLCFRNARFGLVRAWRTL